MLPWMLLALLVLAASQGATESVKCAARKVGQSVVCVCNSTYCDTLERQQPEPGHYVQYTSSKDGLRFSKSVGEVQDSVSTTGTVDTLLEVNSRVEYQTVEGFGGAVTDAAGINWRNLSHSSGDHLIRSYFTSSGLEYNMIRVPIGGSDFSTHPYAYNELPENDVKLSNFTLSQEDIDYKLPMIKAALEAATSDVHVVATTWSPPLWMKTNGKWSGFSRLKDEYYQTYADYHIKFLKEYGARGVKVWAITTTNEPVNGVIPLVQFNSLGWTPENQAKWVVNNLGPTLRKSDYKDTLILAVDDQRYTVLPWIQKMVSTNASVLEYVKGVAVHYYGDVVPAELLSLTHDHYPQLFILATEACEGSYPWQVKKVDLGSWTRATNYIKDILQDLNHWVVGWIDWNLCLNAEGGPNWAGNRVDSPIIVLPEQDEFVKQPMFYAMGHFAKFVPRGSVRLDVKQTKSLFAAGVEHVAFRTPRGTMALVVYNSGDKKKARVVVDKSKQVTLELPAASISTIEINL